MVYRPRNGCIRFNEVYSPATGHSFARKMRAGPDYSALQPAPTAVHDVAPRGPRCGRVRRRCQSSRSPRAGASGHSVRARIALTILESLMFGEEHAMYALPG